MSSLILKKSSQDDNLFTNKWSKLWTTKNGHLEI
jgi:hypothetical protein